MTPIRSARRLAVPLALALTGTAAAAAEKLTVAEVFFIEANWQLHTDDSYIAALAGCYEMLTKIGADFKVEPMLATSWTQTSPTTWEFAIREGVKFQDGTPLTAEAVAGSLNFLLDAPVPARPFSKKIIAKVEATGPMTVTITTLEPVVTLPGRLGAPPTTILSPAAYKDGNVSPVGTCTGPFEITSVDPQQGITTVAFDDYWGGPAKLAGADIRFIPDADTRATMIRSGEAQIARVVPPYAIAQLEGDEDLVIHKVEAPRVTELLLNNGRAPFNDERVRQAVKLAIDAAGISDAVFEGLAPAAGSPFRPGEPWAPTNTPPVTPNLEKAKALLEEAGVAPGSLNLELLAYTLRDQFRDIAAIVQAMLGEIGITVNVRLAEYAAIEPDMLAGNFDMAILSRGYLTDAPEPVGFLSADYSCDGSYNISQFCNADIDAKLDQISAEPDAAKRASGYAGIAQQLYDQAVTIWLVNEPIFDIAAASVEGYAPHPLNYYALTTEVGLK